MKGIIANPDWVERVTSGEYGEWEQKHYKKRCK